MKIIFTFILTVFLYSCVNHRGMLTPSNSLKNENVEFVDIAIGYNRTNYFAGIGGYRQDAFLNEVKRSLMANYSLKPNQTFENISVDIKTTTFALFQRVELIAIADVVQYEKLNQVTYGENYQRILNAKNPKEFKFIHLNEDVSTIKSKNKIKDFKVIGFEKRKAVLFNFSKNGTINISRKNYSKLFKYENHNDLIQKTKFGINDSVMREMEKNHTSNTILNGKIIAVSSKKSLVAFGKDTLIYRNSSLYKND